MDGTFWLSNNQAGTIEHYGHYGSLLGSFATGVSFEGSLAFDPADSTLWMSQQFGRSLFQFDQSGGFLQSHDYSNIFQRYPWKGIEFNLPTVPEPCSFAVLTLGVIGAIRRRRR